MQKYIDNIDGLTKQFEEKTLLVLNAMESALVNFATIEKLNFKDMTRSIFEDILKIMIRMADDKYGSVGNGDFIGIL